MLGERIVRYVLEAWERPETRKRGVVLLRAGIGNRLATPLLVGVPAARAVRSRIAARLDTPDAALRASLVASQIAGLLIARYVLQLPALADGERRRTRRTRRADVQRYLDGVTAAAAPERRKESHDVPGIPRQHRGQDGAHPSAVHRTRDEKGFGPGTKSGEIVAWLGEDYGLGRGHAMALVHVITKGDKIDAKHVDSGGAHSDPSDTLWLDGKATNPAG